MDIAYLPAMSELQQIIPQPAASVVRPYQTPDERWQEVCEEIYGSSEFPQTIHHQHDEHWDDRFWSIQNANDQAVSLMAWLPGLDAKPHRRRFGFWSLIGLLMVVGDIGWIWVRFC